MIYKLRKFLTLSILSLLFILLITPNTTLAQSPPNLLEQNQPFTIYRYRLPNGLSVWHQPRTDSESVATLLVINVGARHEDRTNNGVSHFVEHMLFTGTERWQEEEIKEVIRNRGGRWNGWTSLERTTYFAHLSDQDFEIALDWLSQVVFHATFPEDKVDKEREVVFQEKWGRYGWFLNTLDALGFGYELDRDIRRSIFPDSTLGFRVIGEDAALDSLDREALWGYYKEHYTPENMTLIVVGNVTLEEVQTQTAAYLGELEPSESPTLSETPALPENGPHHVVIRGPLATDQIGLMTGARTVGRSHPDRWPLTVLAEIASKDLMEEIRYQRGLVYGLRASNVFFDDAGYFYLSTTSDRSNRETILEEIDLYMESLREDSVSPERLAEAQTALKGRWALSMEDNVDRARWLAQWVSVISDDEVIPDHPALFDAVAPTDLSRVIETYFTPERRYVGEHLPAVTVVQTAWVFGGIVGLGLLILGVRRLRRS